MRWTPAIVCLVSFAAATAAYGEPAPPSRREQVADVALGELRRTEIVKHKGPLLSLHVGYHGDVAGMAEVRLGFGTGKTKESLLFPVTRVWRFSAAARGAYGKHDSLAVSALVGRSRVGFFGWSLEGGLDAVVISDGDVAVGPLVSLGVRFTKIGLHTNVWTHVVDDRTDWGFSLAVGGNLGDHVSPTDVAKKRAKAKVETMVR